MDGDIKPVLLSSMHLIRPTSCKNQTLGLSTFFFSLALCRWNCRWNSHINFKIALVLHFPAPAIWSVIFMVLYLTGLAFSVESELTGVINRIGFLCVSAACCDKQCLWFISLKRSILRTKHYVALPYANVVEFRNIYAVNVYTSSQISDLEVRPLNNNWHCLDP